MPSFESVVRAVAPRANSVFLAQASAIAPSVMAKWGFATAAAQAELIAQWAHETQGFTKFVESLSYSAPRLTEVWPARFPTLAAAQPFARNERALGNKVYNGRMGNRVGTDDGFNFRGSGLDQHTGASEFARVKRRTGADVVGNPDLLRRPADAETMLEAGCSYFIDRGVLEAMKRGDTHTVTVKLNGGTTGLADRLLLKKRAVAALAGEAIVIGATARAAKVEISEKTTAETAQDTRCAAKTVTSVGAAGSPGSGGATKTAGSDWSTAIGVGIAIAIVGGFIAWQLWKKAAAARAVLDRQTLETLKARLESEPVASAA